MAIIASAWTTTVTGPRIEWSEVKDRIDIAAITTNLLGPAAKRQGPRLLWPCPFHDDHDPSFQVDLTRKSWRCWVCGVGGDAAELVKRFNKCDFPATVKYLAELSGAVAPQSKVRGQEPKNPIPREVSDLGFGTIAKRVSPPPEQPSGLFPDEASTLVDEATACLWGPGGGTALDYLRGRGLTDETIRGAGLGFTPYVMVPTRAGDRCVLVRWDRHPLEGRRPTDPDQDPPPGRWQAEVCGSLLRSSTDLSRPGCHSTWLAVDRQ